MFRHSSCVGESWNHAMFKVKYCHKVFDIDEVRIYVYDLLMTISANYNMPIKKVGFDPDHLHFDVDIRLRSKPEAAKIFRGMIGRLLLKKFPEIKRKFFWNSGFWNLSYYLQNIGSDQEFVENYIAHHKYVY